MVNDMTGNALDVSQVADTVNRSMVGYSQKQRNQAIRQGIQDPTAFAEQNKNFLSQASQPTELGGTGNQNQYDYSSLDAFNKTVDTAYNDYLGKQYGGKFDLNSILGEYGKWYADRATVIDTPEELDYATRNPFTEVKNNYGENFDYWLAGIQDPTNLQYNKYSALGIPLRGNAAYAVDNPGVQGQNLLRGTGDPYVGVADPRYMDNPTGMAELYKSYNITPEQYSLDATRWSANNTAAAQAARSGGGGGLGGLFSGVFNFMDPILDTVNPLHNWTQDQIVDIGGFDSQEQAFSTIAPIVLSVLSAGAASGAAAGAGGAAGTAGGVSAGAAGAGTAAGMGGALGSGITAGATGAGLSAGAGLAGAGAGGVLGTGLTLSQVLQGVNALNSLSTGDYLGAAMGGANLAGFNPTASLTSQFSGLGLSPTTASVLGNVGSSAAMNIARGMDADKALTSAIFSGASGLAGNTLTSALNPSLGGLGSNILGGAASGGLNSLFNKNDVVAGSLFGGMSGGLHGFLNTVGQGSEGKPVSAIDNSNNKQTAQNITKLAQLFYKNRKK